MRAVHKNIPVLFKPYDWIVEETEFSPETNRNNETLFSIGNGYLGVRGFFEEGAYFDDLNKSEAAAYINGVYEFADFNHVWRRTGFPARYHSIVNQANPFWFKIRYKEEIVSLGKNASGYRRAVDFRTGVMSRSFTYTFKGGEKIKVEFERFASQTCKNALFMRAKITALSDLTLELECILSGLPLDRCGDNCTKFNCLDTGFESGAAYTVYSTKKSGFTVCSALNDSVNEAAKKSETVSGDKAVRTYTVRAAKNTPVIYERAAVYTANTDYADSEVKNAALNILRQSFAPGFEAELQKTRCEWDNFWYTADVKIDGDMLVQQGVRFALFTLNQSCGRDGKTNISANGLTGSGYEGWYFWDTEIFMLPVFLYIRPEIARKLLEYRYHILPKAKERAREVDGEDAKGALYSWMSTNGEECTHMYECAPGQIHINPDICFAVKRYLEATDDYGFIENFGAEILFETSIYMAHRGSFIPMKGGKFCFNVVCGPDEYSPAVDNNTYTNWLTKIQFLFTLEIYGYLKLNNPDKLSQLVKKCGLNEAELDLIKKAADNMYIGFNEELGIYAQDDQFFFKDPIDLDAIPKEKLPLLFTMHPLNLWRYQVCKQADLVLLTYLCGDGFTKEMKRKIFDYYEPKTIHDSSLSAGIHSIVACDIGYRDEAYGYLKQSARMDLDNINRNTYFGAHTANMGSTYQIIVNGFAGMRAYGGKLCFDPFSPENWNGYSFRVKIKNSLISVSVNKNGTVFKLLEGAPVTVNLAGTETEIK